MNGRSMRMMTCRKASGVRESTPSTAVLEDDRGQEGENPEEAEADQVEGRRRQGEVATGSEPV
jgi:hypothetical protein